jgi:3-methyladenine DNA glycosylase Tag
MTPETHEKLARAHLSLLEREAQLHALEKKLDDAIQETVRSKAKLASQESRAEAATNLAEAEVALKTLRGASKGMEKRPDYARAAQVMAMSTEELKKENYGGSLYLTNQLKSLLRELQDRLETEPAGKSGAGPSALPSGADPETRLARLQTMLSDRDAQVRAAEKKLDDTIQETVRTKAKLRSQENRAEAASNLAEAEGALKMLRGAGTGMEKQPELARVTALAAMSAKALKKENYSGSLYVANQVKAVAKELSERSLAREAVPVLEGETPFARPLTLRTAAAGKIREQPSNDSAVAWSVDRGASVTGHAYKGLWIRVRGEDQRWGWLFYDLLAAP